MIEKTLPYFVFSMLVPATAALAQNTTSPSPVTTVSEDEIVELEGTVQEEFVPLEENILPSTRPIGTVTGFDESILNISRNITVISREELDAINVRDVRDFAKLTSSSFTTTNFGAPATPSIRGFVSDTAVNGIRRGLTSNGNGLPINFNAVESLVILKGANGVLHGGGNYEGGIVDFITKKPYFDRFRGTASFTYGSFNTFEWTLDIGGPISDKLAYRVSYSGAENESFYDLGKLNSQAIYWAITYKPNDRLRIETNFEYLQADYTENWGFNRPTQDFIDSGATQYITGDVAGNGVGPTQVGGGLNANADGFNLVNVGDVVELDDSLRLLAPGDDSFGRSIWLQTIATFDADPDTQFVNNNAIQWIDRDTYSSYQYSEVLRHNLSMDNRTEYRKTFDWMGATQKLLLGFHFRWQDIWAANDFFHEPAGSWDLSQGLGTIGLNDAAVFRDAPFNGGFTPSVRIANEDPRGMLTGRPGTPGGFYDENGNGEQDFNEFNSNGDTNDSVGFFFAPLIQHTFNFNDVFMVTAGARVDLLYAKNEDPLFEEVRDVLGDPNLVKPEDERVEFLPNFNISPTFRVRENVVLYGTWNFSETYRPGNGGGFGFTGGSNEFIAEDFNQENRLFEVGMKGTFFRNTLDVTAALFDQIQNVADGVGGSNEIKIQGFEFEAKYQPNRNFFATLGYSFLDARQDTGFITQPSPIDELPLIPDSDGDGFDEVLTPTFTGFSGQEVRRPGVPRHQINALVQYQFDNGLGFNAGVLITGPMLTGFQGASNVGGDEILGTPDDIPLTTVEIPFQHTLDLTGFYRWKGFEARVSILNATDQTNFSPPNPVYGNTSILLDPPVSVLAQISYTY
ncbi:MAG: TonB-dependent receptor [Opitutales bacterium]